MLNIGIDPRDFAIIEKNLETLTKEMQREAKNKAVKKAADWLARKVRGRIPVKTGRLRKSMGAVPSRSNPDNPTWLVTYRKGGAFKGYHAHLVEYGHDIWRPVRYPVRGKNAVPTGRKTKGKQILKPTFQQNERHIRNIIKSELNLDNIARKFIKSSGKAQAGFLARLK